MTTARRFEIIVRKLAARPRFRERILKELKKSRRSMTEVNISRIQRHAKENEVIFVPGKVLGHGFLTKKLTVGAFSFSQSALKKITAAGGRPLLFEDFLKEFKDGSEVRIIG